MKFQIIVVFGLLLLMGVALVSAPISRSVLQLNGPVEPVIVIDAGHGGEDGGAVSADGLKESDVNLAVGLRLDRLLAFCGISSVLTRDSDTIAYPDSAVTIRQRKRADQEYRAALINSTEGAVLLSIHQNQFSAPGPSGAQVFYGRVPGSKGFAETMQSKLAAVCGDQRKATSISDEIYLLRQADCPAILVECGFLSNPEELEKLKTDNYRTKLAVALAAGCLDHYHELEERDGKS